MKLKPEQAAAAIAKAKAREGAARRRSALGDHHTELTRSCADQAKRRVEQAEARTELAKTRAEQAETRIQFLGFAAVDRGDRRSRYGVSRIAIGRAQATERWGD